MTAIRTGYGGGFLYMLSCEEEDDDEEEEEVDCRFERLAVNNVEDDIVW
jgi:hypothetical protein